MSLKLISGLTDLVTRAAPDLVGLLAGDKAEAVATKVMGIARDLTGLPDAEAVEAIQKDKELARQFEQKLADQKHQIKLEVLADKRNARGMYMKRSAMADEIAKRIMRQSLPMILLLVVANILAVVFIKEAAVALAVGNVLGAGLQQIWRERSTIIEFFFGAMDPGDGESPGEPAKSGSV